jgi:ABC-type uncharacterized transport system substrate-binding protein
MNRSSLWLLTVLLLASIHSAEAQEPKKVPRIGILSPSSSTGLHYYDSFQQGLRELGYIEGKNIVIEIRFAEGKPDRLFDLATDLVKSKVDVIVTATSPAVLAAKKATNTVPIVFAATADPVRPGWSQAWPALVEILPG